MVEITPKLIHEKTTILRERQIQDIIFELRQLKNNKEIAQTKHIVNIESDLEYLNQILHKEWVPVPNLISDSLRLPNFEINEDISLMDLQIVFPAVLTKEKDLKVNYDLVFDDKSISDSTEWVISSFSWVFRFMGHFWICCIVFFVGKVA